MPFMYRNICRCHSLNAAHIVFCTQHMHLLQLYTLHASAATSEALACRCPWLVRQPMLACRRMERSAPLMGLSGSQCSGRTPSMAAAPPPHKHSRPKRSQHSSAQIQGHHSTPAPFRTASIQARQLMLPGQQAVLSTLQPSTHKTCSRLDSC